MNDQAPEYNEETIVKALNQAAKILDTFPKYDSCPPLEDREKEILERFGYYEKFWMSTDGSANRTYFLRNDLMKKFMKEDAKTNACYLILTDE